MGSVAELGRLPKRKRETVREARAEQTATQSPGLVCEVGRAWPELREVAERQTAKRTWCLAPTLGQVSSQRDEETERATDRAGTWYSVAVWLVWSGSPIWCSALFLLPV